MSVMDKRKAMRGRPKSLRQMQSMSIRLRSTVVEAWKSTGSDWRQQIVAALAEFDPPSYAPFRIRLRQKTGVRGRPHTDEKLEAVTLRVSAQEAARLVALPGWPASARDHLTRLAIVIQHPEVAAWAW